nr:transmembrane protease serine 9-like [Penaeus vannamei]
MSRAGLACGARYIPPGSSRILESSGYPANYRNKFRCLWTLTTSEESSLSIDCDDFLLQPSRGCRKDFLRIWGSGTNKKYCGSRTPEVSVEGRRLRVLFKTNRKINQRGFRCYVRASSIPEPTTTTTTTTQQTTTKTTTTTETTTTTTEATTSTTPVPTTLTTSSTLPDCPDCGLVNRATRIVGGVETEVNEYPWMVSLVNGGGLYHFCGGAIISDEWVVTAATALWACPTQTGCCMETTICTSQVMPQLWHLTLLSLQIKVHPGYDSNTLDNDIALLKLADPIEFPDDNRIAPVCLPTAGEMYADVDATITGWGAQQQGGSTSAVLFEVTVPTMTNAVCDTKYSGQITANMICAGIPEGGKDSCQGDSGGPMIVEENGKWKLVGVVSWGYGCAQPNKPGVYARVTRYLSWISESTTGLCSTDNTTPTTSYAAASTSSNACTDITSIRLPRLWACEPSHPYRGRS